MSRFLFCFFGLIPALLFGQNPEAKRTNIWYFGNGAGLDFSNGSPVAITDGALHSYEGGGSICDLEGNLLFYTDGDTVWDRLHNPMPNGTGLLGCGNYGSSGQSGLIIPKPGSVTVYYIFTNDCFENFCEAGLRYSIVDMNLNSGFGDVTDKNILMLQPSTEALSATKHANGVDYWVMGHEYNSNRFFAYLLDENGLSSEPVITEIGHVINDYIASIKFSYAGDKLAMAFAIITNDDQLFQFDNLQGELFGLLLLDGFPFDVVSGSAYTVAFSPDDSKLYYMQSGNNVYQYCLNGEYTEVDISATATVVAYPGDNSTFGQFQLGLDNKMYIASQYHDSLSTIEFPNLYGTACNLEVLNFYMGGRQSELGLPSFLSTFLYDPTLIPEDCDTIISIDESLLLDDFMVFPNPTLDVIQIELGRNEKGLISLFNATGQEVLAFAFQGQIATVDLSGFAAGMYYLIVETYEKKQFKKTIFIQNK